MTGIASAIAGVPVVYAAVSVINTFFMMLLCVLAIPAVTRVSLRRNPALWILCAVLCVFAGLTRRFRVDQESVFGDVWELANTVLPFVCVAVLVPFRHLKKALIMVLSYLFIEAIKYLILTIFFEYSISEMNDPLELLVELLVNCVFMFLVLLLLRHKKDKRNIFEPLLQISPLLYILIVITFVVFLGSVIGIGSIYTRSNLKQFVFLLLNIPLFAATLTFAVATIIKTRTAELNSRRQLEQQIRHYEMMEKMNEDLRIFRHDLPKKLRPLAAYLENDDLAAAKELMREMNVPTENPLRFSTGNYRLDTVLFCEQEIAAIDGIRITYDYGSHFPSQGIDPDDLYTIFPNALDNAIEACRKVEGEREIHFASRVGGDTVFVSIKNPYAGSLKMKNGLPQTNKEDKKLHGYGLRSIRKAAAKYGSDNVQMIAENGVFEMRLSLQMHTEQASGTA